MSLVPLLSCTSEGYSYIVYILVSSVKNALHNTCVCYITHTLYRHEDLHVVSILVSNVKNSLHATHMRMLHRHKDLHVVSILASSVKNSLHATYMRMLHRHEDPAAWIKHQKRRWQAGVQQRKKQKLEVAKAAGKPPDPSKAPRGDVPAEPDLHAVGGVPPTYSSIVTQHSA